jgi:hypothetical protein
MATLFTSPQANPIGRKHVVIQPYNEPYNGNLCTRRSLVIRATVKFLATTMPFRLGNRRHRSKPLGENVLEYVLPFLNRFWQDVSRPDPLETGQKRVQSMDTLRAQSGLTGGGWPIFSALIWSTDRALCEYGAKY